LRAPVRRRSLRHIAGKLREAHSSSEAWPEALASLTDALDSAGAACILFDRKTRSVDWACFSGLSADLEARYVQHYGAVDPFTPVLNVMPGWTRLSQCFPAAALARDEWYNDFVLACGVRDIIGTRLIETRSHLAIFGLHQQIGRSFHDDVGPIVERLAPLLRAMALRQIARVSGQPIEVPRETIVPRRTRYFFHVGRGRTYRDESGAEFATPEDAIAYASVVAEELGRDGEWQGFTVIATDAAGKVVARKLIRS
jgi:hypothetical protein